MAIWMGDYYNQRIPADWDGYVLVWKSDGSVIAKKITEAPSEGDGDGEWVSVSFGPDIPYRGEVPLPPEHPDDIATDLRILAQMKEQGPLPVWAGAIEAQLP